MKFLISISVLILLTLNIEAKYEFKKNNRHKNTTKTLNEVEQNVKTKKSSNLEFNYIENNLDKGCINKLAGLNNKYTDRLSATYYSVMHETWRTNKELKRNIQEPTMQNINKQLLDICNEAMGKDKNVEFLLYERAMKFKLNHDRFFEIIDYMDNHKF